MPSSSPLVGEGKGCRRSRAAAPAPALCMEWPHESGSLTRRGSLPTSTLSPINEQASARTAA